MDLNLQNRVVLVAGSTRGIGRAIAESFLREGCRTAITGRDVQALESARLELEKIFGADHVLACPGDLTDPRIITSTLDQLTARWGNPDCVVANIGSGRGTPGWSMDEPQWAALLDTNFWASVRLVSQIMPRLTAARRGSVLMIASITGVEATAAPLAYSAAKAALINYAKNLARQVASFNVRVNCVAPGNVLFPGGSWERHLAANKDKILNFIKTEVPLQRFGTPEEIADLVVFLSSDRASFVTGACVIADGGQTHVP